MGKVSAGMFELYIFLATAEIIYLVLAYAMNVKDSLSHTEKSELKRLTKLLKSEV